MDAAQRPFSKSSGNPDAGPGRLSNNGDARSSDARTAPHAFATAPASANHLHPFEMPSDEEVFRLREEEKRQREDERALTKTLSVQDKTTFTSRMGLSRITDVLADIGGGEDAAGGATGKRAAAGDHGPTAPPVPSDLRRREKENMAGFIAKKREIFLVQMSLDTKRSEIRKLEERALQREEALRTSEAMLEEDALRFDAFLKENDEKVQDAIKRSELETKAKNDKVAEIKRLNAAIAAIKSELNKYEEMLEDCRKYKDFLDNLTPPEWFREQAELSVSRRREAGAAAGGGGDDEDESGEMFFKRPLQLLDIFAQLEEQNLFLIQNCQETEEALEELKNKYRETKGRMETETDSLAAQIDALRAAIGAEEDRGRSLRSKVHANSVGATTSSGTSLEDLSLKVREVYQRCGFEEDPSINSLQMLTNVESKLEEHLATVATLPPEFVESAEKAKEKERRQSQREEKLETDRLLQLARAHRSLERAQAPVHKKVGKPMMARSKPPQQKKIVDSGPKVSREEADLDLFLKRDY